MNTVITACANCRIVLEGGLEHYEMDTEVIGLTELVAKYLEQGLNRLVSALWHQRQMLFILSIYRKPGDGLFEFCSH